MAELTMQNSGPLVCPKKISKQYIIMPYFIGSKTIVIIIVSYSLNTLFLGTWLKNV